LLNYIYLYYKKAAFYILLVSFYLKTNKKKHLEMKVFKKLFDWVMLKSQSPLGWGVKNNQNILFFFVLFIIFAKNK